MSFSYTYVPSDSALDTLEDERDFSHSISPAATEAFDSNMNLNDGYVPWFIDPENLETLEPGSAPDLNSTDFENQQWDYLAEENALNTNMIYQDVVGNLDNLTNFLSRHSSESNSVYNEIAYAEGGRAMDSTSSSRLEQQILLEIAMPTSTTTQASFKEPPTPHSDLPPSPKRRKSLASTSPNLDSPTENYRKGHNAIEKRYRSNLNAKIMSLEQCLPLQEIPEDELEAGAPRTTKSSILTRAVQHIEFLKQNTRRLTAEAEDLNKRCRELEKIALGTVVEVVEVEPEEEEDIELPTPPETAVENAILNSKMLTRRRLRRGDS